MPPAKVLPIKPAEQRAATEPATRTYRLWTVDMLRLAEAAADGGNLSRAAELCDALLGDDRIPSNLQTRAQALFGLVPSFEASGDGRRKNRAVKALEAGEDWWAMADEAESLKIFWWGILLGGGPAELRWFDDEGRALMREGRNVPQLRFRHPKHLRRDTVTKQWLIAVGNGEEVPFTPGDGHWFLFAPYGVERFWTMGAWRGLARWWLLKLYAIADWGEHGERGASLIVESDLDADTVREQRKQLASDLAQMAAQGVCVLPPGFKAKLLEISANTTAIYDAQKNAANDAFGVRLLGHNTTSEVKSGSLAAARVGDDVRLDLRRFDAEAWSSTAHDQALTHWSTVNFGDATLAPWPIYPVDPPADRKAAAEELNALGDGLIKLAKAPEYIDIEAILVERGIPLRKGVPVVSAPPTPPALPPAPDAPPPEGEALRRRALANGAANSRRIVTEGMIWSDRVVEEAARLGSDALGAHTSAVLAAIEEATSYEDLQARLLALLDGRSAGFEQIVYRALMLAQGRGAATVMEENE